MATERGEFSLFALLLREDAVDKWDLLLAAPWLKTDNKESLTYVVNKIRAQLTIEELLSLSRIVLLEKGNPVLEALHRMVQVQHGMGEMQDSLVFGMLIKHAYLITSRPEVPGMEAAALSG